MTSETQSRSFLAEKAALGLAIPQTRDHSLFVPREKRAQKKRKNKGISWKWKPRPFPCCAVSPFDYQERSTAVVTSNHGAKAKHSASVPPNASSTPLTKSFMQAIPASEVHKKTSARQPEVGQPPLRGRFSLLSNREKKAAGRVLESASLGYRDKLERPRRTLRFALVREYWSPAFSKSSTPMEAGVCSSGKHQERVTEAPRTIQLTDAPHRGVA